MIGIYKFTNKLTGEAYIGQSRNIQKRYNRHKCAHDITNTDKKIERSYFHLALYIYGFNNFTFEILEECTVDQLNDRESYYIQKFNTLYPHGYNMTNGGYRSHFCKLNSTILNDIYCDLEKNHLTEMQIADKYKLHHTTISQINVGAMWHQDGREYPIRKVKKEIHRCEICGKVLYSKTKTGLCTKCYRKRLSSHIPQKEALFDLLVHNSFSSVGEMFGVTGNAVKKWCDKHNLPRYASYYRNLPK